MRRSHFTYAEIIIYLDAPLRALFATEEPKGVWNPKLDDANVPLLEQVIVPEEDKIIAMGFPCVASKHFALLPIVAAFVQYSLIQRSNQQLAVPYSQITQSYRDALLWLENNQGICGGDTKSIGRQIISSKNRRVNAGW
jgi:hypothetical protein